MVECLEDFLRLIAGLAFKSDSADNVAMRRCRFNAKAEMLKEAPDRMPRRKLLREVRSSHEEPSPRSLCELDITAHGQLLSAA